MNKIKQFVLKQIDTIVVGLVMLGIFSYIMFVIKYNSDLISHAEIAQKMLNDNSLFSNNFLMFFMANLLTLFSGSIVSIQIALVMLISLSNTVKYVLVREAFEDFCTRNEARIASAVLLVVYIIPVFYFLKVFGVFLNTNTMYLGYYVPNVWHNSTILCMMPFAIMTYLLSIKQFKEFDKKRNGIIILSVIFGVLVKPSFFFVYAVAYPVVMFARYRVKMEFFLSLVPIVLGVACVIFEYLSIYTSAANMTSDSASGVAVMVSPLFTLGFWKSHLFKLVISLAFPVLFLLAYRREIVKDIEFWFVLVMLVMALGVCWCCHETGPRAAHGNFYWQVVPSMWFVFYYMLKMIIKCDFKSVDHCGWASLNKRGKFFACLYAFHVIVGIFYLIRFLWTRDFG